MPSLTPNLWFDGNAEEAANFYASVFPDSRVVSVNRAPADTPSGPKGYVVTVDWTILGQPFTGINGGPEFKFNELICFLIDCADQAEVDRYWDDSSEGTTSRPSRRSDIVRWRHDGLRREPGAPMGTAQPARLQI